MTAYDDLDTPAVMHGDAAATGTRLASVRPEAAYADLYSGFPSDQPKPQVEITAATQRLAKAIFD